MAFLLICRCLFIRLTEILGKTSHEARHGKALAGLLKRHFDKYSGNSKGNPERWLASFQVK